MCLRCVVSLLLTVVVLSHSAFAQTDDERRERRRQFMEGLLKTIVDSQLDDDDRTDPRTPPRPIPAETQAMRTVRSDLASFSKETASLIGHLRHEERYTPAIRPIMSDALQLKANADMLVQKAQLIRDEKQIADDMRGLDQTWRSISHQLGQVNNLGAACRNCSARLDAYNQRLNSTLKISPQIDRSELFGLTMALAANTANVQEDLAIDMPPGRTRDQALAEARTLQSQIESAGEAVAQNMHYDEVIKRYKAASQSWRSFAPKARANPSESLNRNLRRLERLHRAMHQQLWLEEMLDTGAAAYYARVMNGDLVALFDSLTVAEMMSLEEPADTFAAMKELGDLCDMFAKSAAGNASADDLMWDFRLLEVQWQQVRDQLNTTKNAKQHLAMLDRSAIALKESLNVTDGQDSYEVENIAAEVDDLAVQLDRDLRTILSRSRSYSSQQRAQAAAVSHKFHDNAHRLRESLSRRAKKDQLQRESQDLIRSWQDLVTELNRLTSQDRVQLAKTAEQVVPLLVKLQMMLAY